MIQEIFGVNAHIRSVADKYAAEGYHVVSPALFDRAERGVELGYGKAEAQKGVALRAAIPLEETLHDVQAAVAAVEGVRQGRAGRLLLGRLAGLAVGGARAGACGDRRLLWLDDRRQSRRRAALPGDAPLRRDRTAASR